MQVPPNKQLYVFEVDGSIRVAEDEVFAPTVCGSQTAAQVLYCDPVRAFTLQYPMPSGYCRHSLLVSLTTNTEKGHGWQWVMFPNTLISLHKLGRGTGCPWVQDRAGMEKGRESGVLGLG